MKKIILSLLLLVLVVVTTISILTSQTYEESQLSKLKEKFTVKHIPSVYHSKFSQLSKSFGSPSEITEACVSCHTERHKEVMQSNHWNWEREEYVEGKGVVYLGKKNALNNFCIGTDGNEKSCAKCHVGFGMTNSMETFTDSLNIDCLVCHDNSETYQKGSEMGGAPDPSIDLNKVAQSVGKPKRSNCGVCHFFGGGGNNVKHGDLEMSMFEPSKDVDIHMASDGMNLQCVDCHLSDRHVMLGKVYSLSSMNRNRSTCEQCHTDNPHQEEIINEHSLKVACQSCHIPTYAKVNATKTDWDWSTAGKLKNGEPYEIDDEDGNHLYLSIKGDFKWGKNLKPEYVWFNGTADHYLLGDEIKDTSKVLILNSLKGSYADKDAKITPVKIHRAIQPFDPVNRILIQPKLFAEEKGEGALWVDFDWQKAAEVGMKDVNLPFSGKISFLKTEMLWPINHMVSSKENVVSCTECHTRENSRIAGLTDFYMPGRDYNPLVETFGKILVLLTILGVFIHASIRIVFARNQRKGR